MKNLKSKLVALLSLTILGSMLVVPSASADTTWKTLYEQNFQQAGLTEADLTAEGWTGLDKAELSSSGIKGVYPGGGTIKYTADVGSKYKLSGKMYMSYGKNGLVFAFGKSSGNKVTVNISENKSTAHSCGSKSVTFDFKYGRGRQYNYTFLCDGKSVTATLSTEDGSINETKSLTLDEDITPYFEYAHSSYSEIWLQSFKLEVPSDYTKYKTTYTKSETTKEALEAAGWVMKGDDVTVSDTGNITVKAGNPRAVFYNQDLGTDYIATGSFSKWYNHRNLYFNATLKADQTWVEKGFYIESALEDNAAKLYVMGNSTPIATAKSGFGYSVTNFKLIYKNGKITVINNNANSTVLFNNIDLSSYIKADPDLASGGIGVYGAKESEYLGWTTFSVQQPDTDNTLSTLVTSVADDNTVTYSVKANNNGTTALEGAKVIVAAYEAGGRFLGAKMTDCTHMGQTTVSGEIPVTEGKTPAKVKAFFFDGLTNIKPLASSISKTL